MCQLRAGLSRIASSSVFVLGSPKAWLGAAYHEVLEKILDVDFSRENLDSAAERLWNQAIAAQHQRSTLHALDRRFGLPVTWPGYYVARASVFLRARELVAARAADAGSTPTAMAAGVAQADACIRERTFTAFGGRLTGKPDVIRAREIVDYKSGAIIEYDEATQANVVKAGFARQLRIYGFLVEETLRWWPQRGLLLPLAGAGVEIALDPGECTREAGEAVAILDGYNSRLAAGVSPALLASPSPSNCKWCPFKLICPPFWGAVTVTWSGQLDGAAVEGVLDGPPRAIHAGAALAVSMDIQTGSEVPRRVQLAPLNPNMHHTLTTIAAGDRLRLVGLRVRPDGGLVPTQRTVVARVDELPVIALANGL